MIEEYRKDDKLLHSQSKVLNFLGTVRSKLNNRLIEHPNQKNGKLLK